MTASDHEEVQPQMDLEAQSSSSRNFRERRKTKKFDSALEKLKALKSGGSRISEAYEMKTEKNVYDIVSEQDYKEYKDSFKHSSDDMFVVDDQGEGYADDGREWWDEENDEEEDPLKHELHRNRTNQRRQTKAFDKVNKVKAKPQKRINKLFLGAASSEAKNNRLFASYDNAGKRGTGNSLTSAAFGGDGIGGDFEPAGASSSTHELPKMTKKDLKADGDDLLDSMLQDLNANPEETPSSGSNGCGSTTVPTQQSIKNVALLGDSNRAKELHLKGVGGDRDTMDCTTYSGVNVQEGYNAAESHFEEGGFGGDDTGIPVGANVSVKGEKSTASSPGGNPPLFAEPEAMKKTKLKDLPTEEEMEEWQSKAHTASMMKIDNQPSSVAGVNGVKADPHAAPVSTSHLSAKAQTYDGQDWWQVCKNSSQNSESQNGGAAGTAQSQTSFNALQSLKGRSGTSDCVPYVTRKVGDGDEEEKIVRMYWLDAYVHYHTDDLFLFGKVFNDSTNSYSSCCINVKNIERNIFILPREYMLDDEGNVTDVKVTMGDVYNEFLELAQSKGIKKFLAKSVERKYAFELPNIPSEGTYLKVKYSSQFPVIDAESRKGKSFSLMFGCQTPILELFLIKRKLMGPCWLDIKGVVSSDGKRSWCKFEGALEDPKGIKKTTDPPESPPLVVMSLSLKTVLNHKRHVHEIVAVSAIVNNNYTVDRLQTNPQYSHFSIVSKLENLQYPVDFAPLIHQKKLNVEMNQNERSLLNCMIARIQMIDPDIIVGHNFYGFDLDVLLRSLQRNNVGQWSKLGRLHRVEMPKMGPSTMAGGEVNMAERVVMSGRLVCDMYISSKELIKQTSYSLSELARTQLNVNRTNIELDAVPGMFASTEDLLFLIRHCENDAYLSLTLCNKLQALPLAKQITGLSGNTWSRTLQGGRSERNEYLLLHEFHRRKFICPDKEFKSKDKTKAKKGSKPGMNNGADDEEETGGANTKPKSGRRKPAYAGGLVLEPKKGFYDQFILLLDFNSLYPSIIQEYNLCFTTVDRPPMTEDGEDQNEPVAIPEVPPNNLEVGVLPKLLETLVNRRKQVKSLIKSENKSSNPDQAKLVLYDIRQRALKLTANSMYGCLGFSHSRFFAKPIAELITMKGREILQNTVDLTQDQLNLEVIYGDTDSIMVNSRSTDLAQVKQIGNRVKREVNKLYRLLELEIDGIFKTMLLLRKKKYAALTLTEKVDKHGNTMLVTEKETKGLDMVRRDWCELSHDVGNHVLEQILSDKSRETLVEDIHMYLRQIGDDVRVGKVPLSKFVINKGLTKAPEDYPDKKGQPHVQVALRMKSKGLSVQARDTIPYVICQGEDTQFANRAYHPDDIQRQFAQNPSLKPEEADLKVDIIYYLKSQIHPVVGRLCDPIEGTDNAQIAECLGLDPSSWKHQASTNSYEDGLEATYFGGLSQMSDEEKFKNSDKLFVKCQNCKVESACSGVFRETNGNENAENETDKANNTVANSNEASFKRGLTCPSCDAAYSLTNMENTVRRSIRAHLKVYYDGWLVCDDPSCGNRTKQLSLKGKSCIIPECQGQVQMEYSDTQLYTQMLYYQNLFDATKAMSKVDEKKKDFVNGLLLGEGYKEYINELHSLTMNELNKNARRVVNLGFLFNF
eukprot:Nk52_evm15s303 gene=Nk52_evmTU15s303